MRPLMTQILDSILDAVGNKFEPGVLPGLLVDVKSVRSRQNAAAWIEV